MFAKHECWEKRNEPPHGKTKWRVRPAKTEQPGHPPSLIRVFAARMEKAWVLSYPLSAQRRLFRLGGCLGWSKSSLGENAILSWGGSLVVPWVGYCVKKLNVKWASSWDYGIYHIGDQRRLIPTGWLRMCVWRMSLRRTNRTIISWAGSNIITTILTCCYNAVVSNLVPLHAVPMVHERHLSRIGTKQTKLHVRPAKTHPPSLIRVFAFRMKKARILSYPLSAQRRLFRLGECPGWSESSLGAHVILLVLSRCGSFYLRVKAVTLVNLFVKHAFVQFLVCINQYIGKYPLLKLCRK